MSSNKMVVRTRMAPSPTGEYHIGHLRSCLYNYALAKKYDGKFIIRVEDTDRTRFVSGAEERILQVIKDYGLTWDEGPDVGGPHSPYRQTERLQIYQKYIQQLLSAGHAYYSFSTPEELAAIRQNPDRRQILRYDRKWLQLSPEEINNKIASGEKYVIRLKVPDDQIIHFSDLIRGHISINSNEVDDQVLIKSDGIPTYHFAVTVDDHLMGVTHVLRGEEWIVSTPKQVLLYQYFGWDIPIFAHLTVFLDPSGVGKMSKRKGSVSAQSFLDDGYLPEALLNFLMLLGWNSGDNREFYTLEEFVNSFDLAKLHKKAPIFDRKKLDYFNGHYLRQKSDVELLPYYQKFLPDLNLDSIKKLIPITKDRINKFSDLFGLVSYLLPTFSSPVYPAHSATASKLSIPVIKEVGVENFTTLQSKLLEVIKEQGLKTGDFFMELRLAIAGSKISPPLLETLSILGQEKVISRLQNYIDTSQD